jgi:hypothetical protein
VPAHESPDSEQTRRDLEDIQQRLQGLHDELKKRQRVDRERAIDAGDAVEMNPLTPSDDEQ